MVQSLTVTPVVAVVVTAKIRRAESTIDSSTSRTFRQQSWVRAGATAVSVRRLPSCGSGISSGSTRGVDGDFDDREVPSRRLLSAGAGIDVSPRRRDTRIRVLGQQQEKVQSEQEQSVGEYRIPDFKPLWEKHNNPLMNEARVAAVHDWFLNYFFETTLLDHRGQLYFQKLLAALQEWHLLPGGIYQTTTSESRLEWSLEFFLLLHIWDDEQLSHSLYQHYLEVQIAMLLDFPDDGQLQENLHTYLRHCSVDLESTRMHVAKEKAAQTKIVLEGQPTGRSEDSSVSPITSSFLNLWIRATTAMPQEWNLRFAHTVQSDMFSSFTEVVDMRQRRVSSVPTHLTEWSGTGFVEPCQVAVEYVEGVFLPNSLYYSPAFQRLLVTTKDAVCWYTDIWSFPKELLTGETYNLVYLVSQARGCSYNEAAEIATHMVTDKCQEMQLAAAALKVSQAFRELTASDRAAAERYIACCFAFMSATHAFHSRSKHHIPNPTTTKVDEPLITNHLSN